MDPLSISASAVSLACFAGKLVESIARLTVDVRTLPESILAYYQSIVSLRETLVNIEETLQKRRTPSHPLERRHHETISRILTSCQQSLLTLHKELPQLGSGEGLPRRFLQTLEKTIKETRIQDILANMNQRTTVLQLSLSTLSLGAQAGMQRSQDQILQDIRSLTDSIRSAKLSWDTGDGSGVALQAEPQGTLYKEISDWKKTAHVMAAALSFNEDAGSFTPNMSLDTLAADEADDFDPEPGLSPYQSRDILEYTLAANQNYVRRWVQCGIFVMAVSLQRRAIGLQEQLVDGDDASGTQHLADMREELADILVSCDTPENCQEAKSMLQQLLKEEVARDTTQRDDHRRCRLYHKLGELYLRENNAKQARRMSQRAFDGRRAMDPRPRELVQETVALLVKAMHLDQAFEEARGLSEWMRHEWPSEITPPATPTDDGSSLTMLYNWCKEHNMDFPSPCFAFDERDAASGRIPMHCAIELEDQEVLAAMVAHGGNVDKADPETGSTPLHLAASTKNKYTVEFLLKQGARVDVQDGSRMTPLHRAQSETRGLKVAELLLDVKPGLIDEVDVYGKTALYMACEKGNEEMVSFLLSRKADTNIWGPGRCTPLLVAVEVVAQSARKINLVGSLIKHGADPGVRDKYGRTAFDAANNAGLAASEVRELLRQARPARRPESISMASLESGSSSQISS